MAPGPLVLQQSPRRRNFLSRKGLALSQNDARLCAAAGPSGTSRARSGSNSQKGPPRRRAQYMSERATTEGTKRFAERWRERAADEHFRHASDLVVSSIGIGTYLGQPDPRTDAAYSEAIVLAVENGINFIDSAINYRFQRSERSIGAALQQLAAKGIPREEIVLCTKGGYLTPDGAMPSDPNEYFFREYLQTGVFSAKDIATGSHCITPRFLDNQLSRSLKNLGVGCIDVYYVHNPETQLSEIPKPDFLKRVRDAFEFLEGAAL